MCGVIDASDMLNQDIVSMPDKWEYPWYAAWDLAFHTLPLAIVDPDFAKDQMHLMLRGSYLHPNGQMPAYEWNFSDVNPPVHAFATLFLHRTEQALRGEMDLDFLRSTFNKLLLNFTWWVNRKDRLGKNVFEGGFLGLDNIGVFDRSAPLPTGGHLEQADGTAWMALFSQNMQSAACYKVNARGFATNVVLPGAAGEPRPQVLQGILESIDISGLHAPDLGRGHLAGDFLARPIATSETLTIASRR